MISVDCWLVPKFWDWTPCALLSWVVIILLLETRILLLTHNISSDVSFLNFDLVLIPLKFKSIVSQMWKGDGGLPPEHTQNKSWATRGAHKHVARAHKCFHEWDATLLWGLRMCVFVHSWIRHKCTGQGKFTQPTNSWAALHGCLCTTPPPVVSATAFFETWRKNPERAAAGSDMRRSKNLQISLFVKMFLTRGSSDKFFSSGGTKQFLQNRKSYLARGGGLCHPRRGEKVCGRSSFALNFCIGWGKELFIFSSWIVSLFKGRPHRRVHFWRASKLMRVKKYLPLFSIRVATQQAFIKRLFFRTSQQIFLTRVKPCVAAPLAFHLRKILRTICPRTVKHVKQQIGKWMIPWTFWPSTKFVDFFWLTTHEIAGSPGKTERVGVGVGGCK